MLFVVVLVGLKWISAAFFVLICLYICILYASIN